MGVLTYKPVTGLRPNQEYYGVDGQWNVVVAYNKDQYITEPPQNHNLMLKYYLKKNQNNI